MIKIQIDMTEAQFNELKTLMKRVNIQTTKEFINNALTLLEWAINETDQGNIIASIDSKNNKYKELIMPILKRR